MDAGHRDGSLLSADCAVRAVPWGVAQCARALGHPFQLGWGSLHSSEQAGHVSYSILPSSLPSFRDWPALFFLGCS